MVPALGSKPGRDSHLWDLPLCLGPLALSKQHLAVGSLGRLRPPKLGLLTWLSMEGPQEGRYGRRMGVVCYLGGAAGLQSDPWR